jgi:hypothetical protein
MAVVCVANQDPKGGDLASQSPHRWSAFLQGYMRAAGKCDSRVGHLGTKIDIMRPGSLDALSKSCK